MEGRGLKRPKRLKDLVTKPAQVLQEKKKEWKLMAFVAFLFVVIIAGLVTVYHFHQEENIYVYHSHHTTVHKVVLEAKFENDEGHVVLAGNLWKNADSRIQPLDCAEEDHHAGHHVHGMCLLWKNHRMLEIEHFELGHSKCHRVHWSFLSSKPETEEVTDCFELGDAHWYGGGLLKNGSGLLERASLSRQPFVTGDLHGKGGFGSVVEPYWLSSDGAAIVVESNSTIWVSSNAFDETTGNTDNQLCFHTHRHRLTPTQNDTGLKYVVCVGENPERVRSDMLSFLVSDPPEYSTFPAFLFRNPVWSTWSYLKDGYNQTTLTHFVEQIVANGSRKSLLMVDDGWESTSGDLEFAPSRFPEPRQMLDAIRDEELVVSLQFRTQVSTKSESFQNATAEDVLVRSFDEDVPSLVRWWNGPHSQPEWARGLAGVVDLTYLGGEEWIRVRLERLSREYGIDMFHLVGSDVASLPPFSIPKSSPSDRNEFTRITAEFMTQFGPTSITASASRCQDLPVLIRLRGGTSTWNGIGGLHDVIPNAITLGLLGYPVFISESIGGSAFDGLPSKDLFVRWLQLSAFLPIMHFSIPPQLYDSQVQKIVNDTLRIRETLVLPEILSLLNDSVKLIEQPIIRPIWWADPKNKEALGVVTEFLVGNKILVAPILQEGRVHRDIYLPAGVWYDPHLGIDHTGPLKLERYRLNFEDVPYFVRQ